MTKRCLRLSERKGAVRGESSGRTLHLTMQSQEKGIKFDTGDSFHIGSKMAGQGLYLDL